MPPALVAMMPPIVAEPSAAKLTGSSRPACAAASWTCWTMQPASTSIIEPSRSTLRILSMRLSESTICAPDASGVAPPARPVLPPWGTTATPAAWHRRSVRETSAVVRGSTTAAGRP